MSGWSLAIDFGTSNTAAAYARRDSDGSVVVRSIALESESTTMPSAVVALDDGFVVGRAAINRAQLRPQAFTREPKRWVAARSVLLDTRDIPVDELIGAVYAKVRRSALDVAGGSEPETVWLTHPQAWTTTQRQTLTDAAVHAGFAANTIRHISEPIAASHFYANEASLPGTKMAVFDFGGGTCDVSVLETRTDGTFRVLHSNGDNHLGGRDFDARLRGWVLEQLGAAGDTDAVAALNTPGAAQLTLLDSVRAAKEELSTRASSFVAVSAGETERELTITRDEYEGLISDLVGSATALVESTLVGAQLIATDIDHVYLTGGSARTPAIVSSLTTLFGKPLERLHDPKLVVAEGALHAPASEETGTAHPTGPVTPTIAVASGAPVVAATSGHAPAASTHQGAPTVVEAAVGEPAVVEPAVVEPAVVAPAPQTPPAVATTAPQVQQAPVATSTPVATPTPVAQSATPSPGGGTSVSGYAQSPAGSAQPAGWYPDPTAPQLLRFWDGRSWSPHTSSRTDHSGTSLSKRRPWYRGPLVLLPIFGSVIVVVVVVVWTIALANSLAATTTATTTTTTTTTTSDAPVTCWNGSEVDPADSCPVLEGEAALKWAFSLDGEEGILPTCRSEPEFENTQVQEMMSCTWSDLPGYEVYVYRFTSVEAMAQTLDSFVVASNDRKYSDRNLNIWEYGGDGETADMRYHTVGYDSIPFAAELAVTPEADPELLSLALDRTLWTWDRASVDAVVATIH